ncbi:MAG TPA: DinB family protein [Roseiflexaceae bacterium]|nr:DinB family protein [Roseiflexaceae bacterium]HMP42888.1 DinB family protein [Roseiflexaceae bacterium]
MTTDQYTEALAALAAFPARLRAELAGLERAALYFKPTGEWSIVENIGHLIDIDVLMGGRVGQIIARDQPTFVVLDVDEAVHKGDYQQKEALFLLNTFAERRAALVEEWRYIQPANRNRTGIHPVGGPRTIEALVTYLPGHDEVHRQQIAATLAAFQNR